MPEATKAAGALPADALREARVRRRTSLEQASRDTRIAIEYLRALEEGLPLRFFPGPVYAKFFLREYARYLGLDEEAVMAGFAARYGPIGPSPLVVLPRQYRVLGPEATRVARAISGGIELPLPRALLPVRGRPRRDPVPTATAAPLDSGRRRRVPLQALGLVMMLVALVGSGLGFGLRHRSADRPLGRADASGAAAAAPRRQAELPRGGTRILPDYRVVAYYGAARTRALGILGVGPREAARLLLRQAKAYEGFRRPVLPAFELVATLASSHPGPDGKYRARHSFLDIQRYLDAAREARALMILSVQPGRADFMDEVRIYEAFLRQPDVSLALDPEWAVGPDQVPGQVLGSVDADTVNEIVAWLSDLVQGHRLPQKLLVIHQFTENMIRERDHIRSTPEVAVVFDVDGVGGRAVKIAKYRQFTAAEGRHYGIKLFYDRDADLLAPLDVINLWPPPDLVLYQ